MSLSIKELLAIELTLSIPCAMQAMEDIKQALPGLIWDEISVITKSLPGQK